MLLWLPSSSSDSEQFKTGTVCNSMCQAPSSQSEVRMCHHLSDVRVFLPVCSLRKRLSVSESSHTESDSSPPLTVRRRCCSAIIEMPRFAISSEEEGSQGKTQGGYSDGRRQKNGWTGNKKHLGNSEKGREP